MECCWIKKRHVATTEQLVVPHVLLCHIQTWHQFLSCQFVSFAVKSGISFSSFSCQSFTLMATICYNLFQWHSQLVTFSLCWSSLTCCNLVCLSAVVSAAKRSCWQVVISHWQPEQSWSAPISLLCFFNLSCFCSSVSAGVARSHLLSAMWVSREAGSLLPSVFSLST